MRLSEIESSKMKSDRQVKELIATRKTESCVRYYDDVISKEWCNKVIDLFEAEKIPISSKFGFNEGNNPRKSFTELDIEGKDKWKDVKETFIKVDLSYVTGGELVEYNIATGSWINIAVVIGAAGCCSEFPGSVSCRENRKGNCGYMKFYLTESDGETRLLKKCVMKGFYSPNLHDLTIGHEQSKGLAVRDVRVSNYALNSEIIKAIATGYIKYL